MATSRPFGLFLSGAYAMGGRIWSLAVRWQDIALAPCWVFLSRQNTQFCSSPRVLAPLSSVNFHPFFNYVQIEYVITFLLI